MEITKYRYPMIFAYSLLIMTSLLFPIIPYKAVAEGISTDESTLVSLKSHITGDPHRTLSTNWTNSVCTGSWIGVTCGSLHHRVTKLNLSGMDLSGTIPPQLGNLSFLVSLDLSHNLFSGALPQQLSLLGRLKFMYLEVNNFTGEIPSSFGLLTKLQHLWLQNNSLSGGIPSAIFNISTLQIMDFTYNYQLSGSLPTDMCANIPLLRGIYLSYNRLSGQIPSTISNCSHLQKLSLSFNSFTGHIPPQIGNLNSIRVLYLGYNNLQGGIPPAMFNISTLEVIGFQRNDQLSGSLPVDMCANLPLLQLINLSHNRFSGHIPSTISNCSLLQNINLEYNNLNGVIPKEIGQLYNLEILILDSNSLRGLIPAELFNISTLRILSLFDNTLSNSLPTNLCQTSPLLEELYLANNSLTGPISHSISNCSLLNILELGSNNFNGFVPHSLGNLRRLEYLQLSGNSLKAESSSSSQFMTFITSLTSCTSLKFLGIAENPLGGVIPASIGNLSSSLQYLDAFTCKIKGNIPAEIGNLTNLIKLSLQGNEFYGNIPPTVKGLQKLQVLYLHENKIEGSIPECLCQLHRLSILYLGNNHLSGPIPECFGNITSLRELHLRSNLLTSTIPSSLWHLTDLLKLDLSDNSLTGKLPPEVGNLVAAISINLSMNQISGSIPTTIGILQTLIKLSIAHNKLEGLIPTSVGSMISLITLDFSYNNLYGPIPNSIETLKYLVHFNVSFNALSGEIPSGGPFRNFTMESFMSNGALCGVKRFHVPPCRIPHHRPKWQKVKLALLIIAGMVGLITIVSLTFIFTRYRRKDNGGAGIDEQILALPQRISYYEILQATEHLNESNLIGIGSFGSVFKGILRDGKVIAVKVFKLQTETSFRSFEVECEVLRNIRHRNLTKVISSCSNEDFKAIVFEYMPNGNLEKWLYSHNYCLDVMQRLNIMIDVASALEYLHHGYSTPIVHCDLKPSNVLLDEDMIAHVTDFGIAKMLGDEESTVLTRTLGTLGYIAPEYGLEGQVSTRCDVYSYGVMLMEMFTRKRPSDDMFEGDLSLKKWVESLLPGSPHEVIDSNLLSPNDRHLDKVVRCISSVLELALRCSAESSRNRINMTEAVSELQKIKRLFFKMRLQTQRYGNIGRSMIRS